MVTDMRALNSVTKKSATPLPLFENLVLAFGKAKYFSVADCTNFYYQIRVQPQDRELTAVATPFGLWEFTVMNLGLAGAPSTAGLDGDVGLAARVLGH